MVSPAVVRYGTHESQFCELTIPKDAAAAPVVVLVHGGFWKAAYGLDFMRPLAVDLKQRGYASWNVEYRRVGQRDGGYPNTLLDVASAIDRLASMDGVDRLDLGRVAVVGHSAGGHLALWCAAREAIPDGRPGSGPLVRPRVAIGLAAVVDLVEAAADGLGTNATQNLLGGEPAAVPDHYAAAQPDLVARTARIVLIHGDLDGTVPLSQSLAGRDLGVELVVIPGADHFDVIDPTHEAWAQALRVLESL